MHRRVQHQYGGSFDGHGRWSNSDESMTAFSNDVYMAGHPLPMERHVGVNAERGGRTGGSCVVAAGVCRGGLITSLELPYKLSRDEPAGVRNRARSSLCRGFGYG